MFRPSRENDGGNADRSRRNYMILLLGEDANNVEDISHEKWSTKIMIVMRW